MSNFRPGSVTPSDKQALVESMLELHQEIAKEIERPRMDPSRLMRLNAAAANQCLVALSALLVEAKPTPAGADPKQMTLFDEDTPNEPPKRSRSDGDA